MKIEFSDEVYKKLSKAFELDEGIVRAVVKVVFPHLDKLSIQIIKNTEYFFPKDLFDVETKRKIIAMMYYIYGFYRGVLSSSGSGSNMDLREQYIFLSKFQKVAA